MHQPILDQDLFDQVQKLLSEQRVVRRKRSTAKAPSQLAGKLFDDAGDRLVPTHSTKGSVRYRYYVSQSLIGKRGRGPAGWRLPAQELEQRIVEGVLGHAEIARLRQVAGQEANTDRAHVCEAIQRVEIAPGRLSIEVDAGALFPSVSRAEPISMSLPFDQKRRGVELRMALKGRDRPADPTLARGVYRALIWVERLKAGASIVAIAAEEHVNPSYISRRIDLGLLSPRIVAALVEGQLPVDLTVQSVVESDMPSDWREQERRLLGPAAC